MAKAQTTDSKSPPGAEPSYAFGEFELDLRSCELRRSGEPRHVEPQVFDVLLYLLQHRDRLVTREELLDAVWGHRFVTPSTVDSRLRAVRRAVEDDGRAQRVIRTVHGRGFRFVAPVEERYASVAAVGARGPGPTATGSGPSVAVLPFADLGSSEDAEYLGDGIAEEIISALGQIPGLRVAARTSSFAFKGRNPAIGEVGTRLGVGAVVEGSVRRSASRLRVTVRLVDVAEGSALWSERYDRELADVFAIEDEIATAICERLRVFLADDARAPLVRRPTASLGAYELYLRGRHHWNRRGHGIRVGLDFFERALELDGDYALAHSGVADACTQLAFYGFEPSRAAGPRAMAAARRALELDPGLAEAQSSLGGAALVFERDWPLARESLQRAVALNPAYPAARYWYSFYLLCVEGRVDEALAQAQHAADLDPLAAHPRVLLGMELTAARRYEEAIGCLQAALTLDPRSSLAHHWLVAACLGCGMMAEAEAAATAEAELSERHPWSLASQAAVAAAAGDRERCRALRDELVARSAWAHVQPSVTARTEAALGEASAALERLAVAFDDGDPPAIMLRAFPMFDALREHPRYPELLRQAGWR
jgi:TolB-like protein/tetratricopeptide (TPR) repeat protein